MACVWAGRYTFWFATDFGNRAATVKVGQGSLSGVRDALCNVAAATMGTIVVVVVVVVVVVIVVNCMTVEGIVDARTGTEGPSAATFGFDSCRTQSGGGLGGGKKGGGGCKGCGRI